MTTTTDDDRAIAEALGWVYDEGVDRYYHPKHKFCDRPRLTDETTLGRAMCYDAIEWLGERQWYPILAGSRELQCYRWILRAPNVEHGSDVIAGTLPAALEAAMIKELGI